MLLAAAILASCLAQTQTTPSAVRLPTAPAQQIQYNMERGVEYSAPRSSRFGPETIFDNTMGVEYYFLTSIPTEEWVDEFAFPARDLDGNQQIDGLTLEYCSISQGMDAVDMVLNFYADTILGTGPSTWPAAQCSYGLAGLPGSTPGIYITCWEVTIDLACGFECTLPEETVPGGFTDFLGVGYMYLDGGTGPVIDSTFGPGGPGSAGSGYGSMNYAELFGLGGHAGTSVGPGGSKNLMSFNLRLYGDGVIDTDTIHPDAPTPFDTLCLRTDAPFRSGSRVTYTLDNSSAGTFALLWSTTLATTPSLLGQGATLLLDDHGFLIPPSPALMTPTPAASFTTPTLPPGLPPTVFAQAFEFSGLPLTPNQVLQGSNVLRHNN
ncbi:MAG: hypothetical protein ACPG31_08760 [Planctomycetota bacterium]